MEGLEPGENHVTEAPSSGYLEISVPRQSTLRVAFHCEIGLSVELFLAFWDLVRAGLGCL